MTDDVRINDVMMPIICSVELKSTTTDINTINTSAKCEVKAEEKEANDDDAFEG